MGAGRPQVVDGDPAGRYTPGMTPYHFTQVPEEAATEEKCLG